MDEIIPFLYIGNIKEAQNLQLLKSIGIYATVICCTASEASSTSNDDTVEQYRIDVDDASNEPIHLYFAGAAEFIDSFISKNEAVLIYCKSGVSRSATILLSYLIFKKHYRLHDAFLQLVAKRRVVCPNIGFMEQLCDLENSTLGFASIDIYKYTDWYTSTAIFVDILPDLNP